MGRFPFFPVVSLSGISGPDGCFEDLRPPHLRRFGGRLIAVMVAARSLLQIDEVSPSIKPSSTPVLLPGLLYGCAGGMVPFPSIPSQGKSTASNNGNDSGAMVTCVNNVNIKGGSGSHGGRPPSDECHVRQAVCAVRTAQAPRCGWTSAGFQAVGTETHFFMVAVSRIQSFVWFNFDLFFSVSVGI